MATSTTYVNYASPVRMPITERVPLGLRIAQASAAAVSCLGLAFSLHWSVGFFVAFLAVIMAIANSTAWLLVRYRGRNPPAKPYLFDGLSAAGLLIGGIWLAVTEDAAFTVTFMCIGSLLFLTIMGWNKFRPQATKKVTLVVSTKAEKDDDEMTHNAYVVLETPGRSLECVI